MAEKQIAEVKNAQKLAHLRTEFSQQTKAHEDQGNKLKRVEELVKFYEEQDQTKKIGLKLQNSKLR